MTVTKPQLKKLAKSGMLQARCTGYYTDDYAGDAANNYGKTDWKPVVFLEQATSVPHSECPAIIWTDKTIKECSAVAYCREGDWRTGAIIQYGPHWDTWELRMTDVPGPTPDTYTVQFQGVADAEVLEFKAFDHRYAAGCYATKTRTCGPVRELAFSEPDGSKLFVVSPWDSPEYRLKVKKKLNLLKKGLPSKVKKALNIK